MRTSRLSVARPLLARAGPWKLALVARAAAGGPVDARVQVEIAGSISVDVREAM